MSGREGSDVLFSWRMNGSPAPAPPCNLHLGVVDPVDAYDDGYVLSSDDDAPPHHHQFMRPLFDARFFNSFDDDFDDTDIA